VSAVAIPAGRPLTATENILCGEKIGITDICTRLRFALMTMQKRQPGPSSA